jgi:TatD DNase family protein
MLLDTHCHLETFAHRGDLPAVLDRAAAAGVTRLITIGTCPADWNLYAALAAQHQAALSTVEGQHPARLAYSVGLHPCDLGDNDSAWHAAIAQLPAFFQTPSSSSTVGASLLDGRATAHYPSPQLETPNSKLETPSAPNSALLAPHSELLFQPQTENRKPKTSSSPSFPSFPSFPSSLPRPIALGEIGLDRFHLPKDSTLAAVVFARQEAAFRAQLDLARDLACPIVIHSRNAFPDCLRVLDEYARASALDLARVVFHCFSDGPDEVRALNQRGSRASFTGIITYKNADPVRAALLAQGPDRLMLETDAPYLAPIPHRGQPNEPAYLAHTAQAAAQLLNLPLEQLAARTTANAREFFSLNP